MPPALTAKQEIADSLQLCTRNLQTIIDAPDGIKKLRELILQLAVQGRLTQQLPEDGNAHDLLKQIATARQEYYQERKAQGQRIQKPKKLPPIAASEIPFEIPESWEWVRLGEVGDVRGGKRIPKGYSFAAKQTDHIYIRVSDMKNGTILDNDLHYIDDTVYEKIKRYTLSKNDLYISIAGTIGAIGSVPDIFDGMNLTENAAKITLYSLNVKFFKYDLMSKVMQGQFREKVNMMAQPKLALSRIKTAISPLPPLPEQKRIVAQVDKLMAYCDELQAAKDRERECQTNLCESAFTLLEQSSDDQELSKHWNFCAENFQALEQTPENASKLRNTILQLAVQGRLTQQLPEDGNARDLLEEIKEAKRRDAETRRGNGQRIQKPKKLPPIQADEIPFEIPENWEWVRIPEVTHACGQKKPDKEFSYIDVSAIDKEAGIINPEAVDVLQAKNAPSRARKLVQANSVIYSTVRPYLLNIAIVDREILPEPIVSTAFEVCHPFRGLDSCFLYFYLRSNHFTRFVSSKMQGMAYPAISSSKFSEGLVPLPPLPEQKRIVAQVEKLTAYCDELEAGFRKREERAGSFCKAVVAGAGVA